MVFTFGSVQVRIERIPAGATLAGGAPPRVRDAAGREAPDAAAALQRQALAVNRAEQHFERQRFEALRLYMQYYRNF